MLTKHDLKAVYLAAHEAERSGCHQRHGAVIYRGKKIISKGYNQRKTHPATVKYYTYPYVHAEFNAVIKTNKNLEHCSIAVARLNRAGHLMLARPCLSCIRLLKSKGIKHIVYTDQYNVSKEQI